MRHGARKGCVMSEKNSFALNIPSNKGKQPKPEVKKGRATEFVDGASIHALPQKEDEQVWRHLDPDARCTRGINVRFNEFELELLRGISRQEDRSVHQIIKRLLIPAARHAAKG